MGSETLVAKKSSTKYDKMKEKNDDVLKKVDIEFVGEKLVVPEGLSYEEARRALSLREHEENVEVNISEVIRCFPLDGAVALQKALSRLYGWTNLIPTEGFFGPQPPQMVSVEIGFNETIQVPWGQCAVPKIDGLLSTGFANENDLPVFRLAGKVKRKDESKVLDIARLMRQIVREESIYRGKAIKINFRDSDGDRKGFDPSFAPKFIDLDAARGEVPIFSKDIEEVIETTLFNPVQHTKECLEYGIPLKRGVLLEGPYGCGKTLTSCQLATICVENEWTFIYLEDARDLDVALSFARLYEPCVLFCEDIDRSTSQRDDNMNKILNSLDGLESKDRQIMVVLTTNRIGSIHPAFVRPGRIDTIIQVTYPDAEACVRLLRKYGCDSMGRPLLEGTDEEFQDAVKDLVGANTSFVREAAEKAKLSAIKYVNNGDMKIRPNDIKTAVKSMLPHIKLINPVHGMKMEEMNINPTEIAFSMLMDSAAESILNRLTDPRTVKQFIERNVKRTPRSPVG